MRQRGFMRVLLVSVVLAGVAGCAATGDAGGDTTAGQVATFVGDFLRQALAAFVL